MTPKKKSTASTNKNISISGDVVDSVVVVGDNNQTIIQKFFNIFKSDSETLEHRNRRILLGHVENAWIKGVLDASLHGAALLDLGIKPDPEAVTQYPWAIQKESTKEILPAGTSMLEIFDSIGMGRSLLILGAPGSGKTTMLLELARQLIARAREDVTYPIPMVFNLASWTEKLTLADWLAQELNNLYSVPRKTAPDWVKGDKLLLLLDGLDEVRQEGRAKCVEAINAFRKEHGLTSLAVCSRSQDYADINANLSFEGAIEVQPLTQKQITEFFNRFGDEMEGIKQVLQKDSALREMAETPLFLSIMIMAYRDKRDVEILMSGNEKIQRKHLFDTYIERMFENLSLKRALFKKQDTLHYLSWLAVNMIKQKELPYFLENMQPNWVLRKKSPFHELFFNLISSLCWGLLYALLFNTFFGVLLFALTLFENFRIPTISGSSWSWNNARLNLREHWFEHLAGNLLIVFFIVYPIYGFLYGLIGGLIFVLLQLGFRARQIDQTSFPGERISLAASSFIFIFQLFSLLLGFLLILLGAVSNRLLFGLYNGLYYGIIFGLLIGFVQAGASLIQHYTLRYFLTHNNLLPWRLVPFLDHCVDLIFLRRVGGGYIFVHRLLMEHFAEMYVETPTSKGN